MTDEQVRDLLLRKAAKFAKRSNSTGMIGWCEKHGVLHAHATQFLAGKRGPGSDLLDALNLEYRIVRKAKR